MALDLQALLKRVQVESRIATSKQSLNARLAQRDAATAAAEQYAKSLEKRQSLQRALASQDMDAYRFRWLSDHPAYFKRLAEFAELAAHTKPQTTEENRKTIDLWIKQETIRKLSELRREKV